MVRTLLFFISLPLVSLQAQNPIFTPSMPVVANGSVSSPAGEGVSNIIDGNINTKFLDFNYWDGMEFTVNTNTMTIATGVNITTANDSAERDPMVLEILGSIDGSTFISIASDAIPCISDRFFTRSFTFVNAIPYQHYRVLLSNQCNTIEQMIQVAEVQLTGTALNVAPSDLSVSDVQLYPNPAGDFFQVKVGNDSIDSIIVVDQVGKTVKTLGVLTDNPRIDISELSSGIYFVKIKTAGIRAVKKLVVK